MPDAVADSRVAVLNEQLKDQISYWASHDGGLSVSAALGVVRLASQDEVTGNLGESARLAGQAVTMMDRLSWPEQSSTADFMEQYSIYLSARGQKADAESWKGKAAALREKLKSKSAAQ